MQIVNGKITDTISVKNRSFAFGDGIFETCKVVNGEILHWQYHFQRLKVGSQILAINLDFKLLEAELKNHIPKTKTLVVKIIISRGESVRGYNFSENMDSIRTILISDFVEFDKTLNLDFCQTGYFQNPNLAGIKHQNRLENILAAKNGDCIMLDNLNNVISTTYANIFIIKNNKISTPNLNNCGILGTRRAIILDNLEVLVKNISTKEILNADEVFISNSLIGIYSINSICGINYKNNKIKQLKSELNL